MPKFRVVAFSILLSLFLGAYQIFIPSAFIISGAQAQSAAKKEQKLTATIALPGVQVETLNPYAHSTTQIYPTWKHVIEPLVEWSWSKKQKVPRWQRFHVGRCRPLIHSYSEGPRQQAGELHRPRDRH